MIFNSKNPKFPNSQIPKLEIPKFPNPTIVQNRSASDSNQGFSVSTAANSIKKPGWARWEGSRGPKPVRNESKMWFLGGWEVGRGIWALFSSSPPTSPESEILTHKLGK